MPPRLFRDESGYSLVEVLMGILILSLGVLGTFALVDGANQRTSDTKGREGATNLARDLVESTRTVAFNNITQADLMPELSTRAGLADGDGAGGWQIERRNFTYTVTYSVCAVDDGSDRLGDAASHASGFCAGTQSWPSASGADRNPVDFQRVVFEIRWRDTRGEQALEQSVLINSTYRGPAVRTLDQAPPGTIFSGESVEFDATLTSNADSVKWFVEGRLQDGGSGSLRDWTWTWNLGPDSCTGSSDQVQDGTYFVSAVGYDRNGGTGGPKAVSVNLNRCVPSAPTGLAGGRNWNSVELSWAANPEADVVGYDVYRDGTLVSECSTSGAAATSCRDENATGPGPWAYTVVAYDTGETGRRAGAQSAELTVLPECGSSPCNRPPNPPSVTIDGNTLTIAAATPDDRDTGDSVRFYRIYRTSGTAPPSGPGDRHDVVDRSGDPVTWTDTSPGDYHYWVTAVDSHYSESDFSAVVP